MDEIDYGKRVAELRRQTGWTQEELAERSGVPKRTLQGIESGKLKKRPQRETREKIDALKAKIEAELGLSTPQQTQSEWPDDVRAFLNGLGRFLMVAMPEEDREAWMERETLRIFEEFGERGARP